MPTATAFVIIMQEPSSWERSAQHQAKTLDRRFQYDRLEHDLAFYYFSDGSRAGVRPMTHQAWVV